MTIILYVVFAQIGFVSYGKNVLPIILFNLKSDSGIIIASYISYAVLLLTSIPLEHLPALKTIEESKFFKEYLKVSEFPWKK